MPLCPRRYSCVPLLSDTHRWVNRSHHTVGVKILVISKPSILKLNALLDEIYTLYADYVMKVEKPVTYVP